jgi:hypothetical protein
MSDRYKIIPDVQYNHQRNALRCEIITAMDRCGLKPRDERAKWLVEHRPFHLDRFWSDFGYCNGKDCDFCVIAERQKDSVA